MVNQRIKNLAFFLVLLGIFLIKTSYTDADIFAERNISRNKFSFIAVDFSARSSFNNSIITSLFSSLGMQPSGFDLGAARVNAETDIKFKYRLKAVKTNGDDLFCSRLQVKTFNRDFQQVFSGSLLGLFSTSEFTNTNPKDYIFFISLDEKDPALKSKICEFNFDFKTFRHNPDEQGGIFARRSISNVISSGNW